MTQEEILEGNILIAEFIQLTRLSDTEWINPVLAQRTDRLAFHESFGWIMPVLEKISKITIEYENHPDRTDTYYPRTFGMLNEETKKPMVRINGCQVFEADDLVTATFYAVVDFIKWRNQQSLTP